MGNKGIAIESCDKSVWVGLKTQGGVITGSRFSNVDYLTTVTRGDGNVVASHLCSPFFGNPLAYAEPVRYPNQLQHGDARISEWDLMDRSNPLAQMAYDAGIETAYPSRLHVRQTHTVDATGHTVSVARINMGQRDVQENVAWHLYWKIGSPEEADEATVNGVAVGELLEDVDSRYIDLDDTAELELPGTGRVILWQAGFETAVVWRGRNPETGVPDRDYVCFEPVRKHPSHIQRDASDRLRPGHVHVATFGYRGCNYSQAIQEI